MNAKITFEIDIRDLRKFAALADIDLSNEDEQKIIGSTTLINKNMLLEQGDTSSVMQMYLMFSGLVIAEQLK